VWSVCGVCCLICLLKDTLVCHDVAHMRKFLDGGYSFALVNEGEFTDEVFKVCCSCDMVVGGSIEGGQQVRSKVWWL